MKTFFIFAGFAAISSSFVLQRGLLGQCLPSKRIVHSKLSKAEPITLNQSPEFSRTHPLSKLGRGRTIEIVASPEELESVKERLGLHKLSRLEGSFTCKPGNYKAGIQLRGTVEGDVEQLCCLSGLPFSTAVSTTVDCTLIDSDSPEAVKLLEADADVELIENNLVELGEIAVQFFSLELDPYPEAPETSVNDLNMMVEEIGLRNKKK